MRSSSGDCRLLRLIREILRRVHTLYRDRQHATIYVGLGSLYPCTDVVERILAPEPGVNKQVIDLGADF